MITKERKWATCKCCDHKTEIIQEEEIGCDECKTPIDIYTLKNGELEYLHLQVFHSGGPTDHLHLCSWQCVFKKLKKVKTDYFISLPYLNCDVNQKGMRVRDFWKAVRESK